MELDHNDEGIDSDNREIVDDDKENDSFGLRGNQFIPGLMPQSAFWHWVG